jgi:hypothetical protein
MTTMVYEGMAGEHVCMSAKNAIALAKKHNRTVRMRFNGVAVTVNKRLNSNHVVRTWQHITNASWLRYQNSTGRDVKAKRDREILRKQSSVDAELLVLTHIIDDKDKLMLWLKCFVEDANNVGVHFDKSKLSDELKGAGYAENQHVGNAPEWFCTRNRMSQYIVGQVVTCLSRGMPPHPITALFVDRYFEIPK